MDLADPQLAQRIIDATPAMALVLDLAGRIAYLNPFGEQLTGHALADLRGQDWFELLLPDDEREAVRVRFHAVLAGSPPVRGCNAVLTRDGRRRDIEWSSRRLEGPRGEVIGVLSTGTDVTERLAAEAALRERELAYRQLFEANPQPMWFYELATLRFLAVNDAAVARYGYSHDEFLAMTIADIRPTEDLPALQANLARAAVQLELSKGWRHRRKDGSLLDVEITSHPLLFDGRAARMVLADDVTERREAERQREVLLSHWRNAHAEAVQAGDRLREMLERVEDGFFALDSDWRYTYINGPGAELLGRDDAAGLIGQRIWAVFPGALDKPFHRACEQAMATQQPVVLTAHYPPLDRWFDNRIYPSPEGLSVYFTDVTLTRRAELARRHSEQLLQHFFDSGLVGMAITVPSKHWGQFNQRLCDMLGRSAKQMASLTWADLTHPDDLAANLVRFERLMAGEINDYRIDKRYIRADGSVLTAAVAVRCERGSDGLPQRFYTIIEDIGARKQAEQALLRHRDELEREVQERTAQLVAARDEAERANQAKSEFLSRMSHELRTPLNAILGFSQLMALDTGLTPKHRDFIDEMLRAGRHLLQLVNDVLDLAVIESGRLVLSPEPLVLADLLDDCLRMLSPLASARGVQITLRGADGVVLRADRTRLRQVLLNLLSNAVKYNGENGQVTIVVAQLGDERARISVIDTGPGIPQERLVRLFEPFERLGAELSQVEGTGVGLNIARQLVELMDGEIGVDGGSGHGACFWIQLPMASLPPPAVLAA